MIVSRIDENGFWLGNYTQEFINRNLNKVLNGLLVSEWILTDNVNTKDFVKPKLENNEWIETAPEEAILLDVKREELKEKRANREFLLSLGIIVNSNGINYWFSKLTLNDFITATQISEKAGVTTVDWKAENGDWQTLPLSEAYQIGTLGMQKIQQIYRDNA